ncbi:UDP-4-amino-4,6-dideoxy-N-acetyl-beta-L-altrosamine transaminase [Helicobacter turcicus]|uniref:UDP-4-amino-4,6-dideoxy-N-acetyl-beta-L-altrosamine transaminase n=1 Tax=Helicobacter turcicus TaxID=2867412 RepID=A0ABS7JLY6_9HELI|nr:UDP-4-amino-4,6-dideoxy-N-acetyl-beta-L-altrosamine transaminase [Helicobacter turcicus]MBX7490409.1 UDP-4-amino-4,6-dideoxy-N-acetyl-beta-L-altrosamine transaminase [Helicobacter turcicus]MBX7545267.1 UDP-4-amino-4,6-dideoxy-N-acetyl-beta-L-altrosamine transaminase [Helicobacter turcicus]
MIPYGKQEILDSDIQAVMETLKSPLITQGPKAQELEEEVAKKVKAKFGVSFNSATSALHCAALALGLRRGDWLWTSTNSFVASANCGIYCEAKVDFVDIDPKTYNLDVDALSTKLKHTKKHKLPKVLVVVHFAGQSCEMEHIFKLAQKYNFKIIEDASHALGGSYRTYPIGCCAFSDITIFSLHPVKIITAAEGGIATTNSPKYAKKMQLLKNHGITKDPDDFECKKQGAWYYEQQIIGFNYRLSELHAALGLSQLTRLEGYVKKRNALAKIYNENLCDLELTLPFVQSYNYSAFHLYVIVLNKKSGIKQKALFEKLRNAGIGVQVHYIPIHLQPFYARFGFKKGDFKNAESYYKHVITLPLFPTLNQQEQQKVISLLKESVCKKA